MNNQAQQEALQTVYVENRSELHDGLTREMVKVFAGHSGLGEDSIVLDVGCGMGPAWEPMRELGVDLISAITPNLEEAENAWSNQVAGYLGTLDSYPGYIRFTHIWCRHVLEHVVSPFDSLLKLNRELLAPGGWLYVEVPAPDTVAHHEANQNHYSVLGDRMWRSLFAKAGFELVWTGHIDIGLEIGPDKYFCYILRKAA